MVEAARSRPRPGGDEVVEQGRCELVEPVGMPASAKRRSRRSSPPRSDTCGRGPACGPGTVDDAGEALVHASTASPSPRATSRSASTATLA